MRITVLVIMMTLCGFTSMAQKGAQKKEVRDSTVFFYGAMELNNGLLVVTPIDSINVPVKQVKQHVLGINSSNKLRILKMAQTELADKDLRIKNARVNMILTTGANMIEIKTALDRLTSVNGGSIFTLNDFKFIKPTLPESGPGKKVTVY